MSLEFKDLTIESKDILEPFFNIRSMTSCEYNFNTLFMWAKHNKIQYALGDEFLLLSEVYNDKFILLMPLCKEENFQSAFETARTYCKENNHDFNIYVTDHVFKDFVVKTYPEEFDVVMERDLFDYLYDGDSLRNLTGKKYNKKRNHLNAFYAENEGRYEFRSLVKEDRPMICKFLRSWKNNKDELTETLNDELEAICKMLDHLDDLNIHTGAVYIDGNLEAFTLGSLINQGREAVIHIEKANDNIRGLYPFINQKFLQESFPKVELVNREEDLGIEGLRKAKLSYYPVEVLEKYNIIEKK